ncbi:MAG: multiprotein bridging factor aMBF1 [Candidatus Heimdallarchaeaceae archaeon]
MPTCEMCGREIYGTPIVIEIEGAVLSVCGSCAKHGKRVQKKQVKKAGVSTKISASKLSTTPKRHQRYTKIPKFSESNETLAEDYAERIRLARQKMKLTQKEVSIQTKISVSALQSIETGKLRPSDEIRKKLEKFFNIKLVEEVKPYTTQELKKRTTEQTLGDVVIIKKKSKKKD